MAKDTVTCRYGITYTYNVTSGSKGARARLNELLSNCCCFVCHNHDCAEPRDERLDICDTMEPHLLKCSIYTKSPYCLRKKS